MYLYLWESQSDFFSLVEDLNLFWFLSYLTHTWSEPGVEKDFLTNNQVCFGFCFFEHFLFLATPESTPLCSSLFYPELNKFWFAVVTVQYCEKYFVVHRVFWTSLVWLSFVARFPPSFLSQAGWTSQRGLLQRKKCYVQKSWQECFSEKSSEINPKHFSPNVIQHFFQDFWESQCSF